MKTLLQITTMLTALSIAGLAVVNFPVGHNSRGAQVNFARAPQVMISTLSGAVRDRLGDGWVVSN